ncbi:MAG: hypothetical protein KGL39_36425, partial [Patescibacteria group bacterium]|nr:hypothetical protein [Patescibacteria group bacterium]
MANVAHSSLTGADLHEPKGVATAASGSVYVANGSGSGAWTDAQAVISNSAWSTGDAKLSYVTSAPSGWILVNDGTIGDGSSGATTRANADCQNLFYLLWGLPANLTVSGGRGASASVDWAAHKTIQVPLSLGRALGIAGTGSGLTARTLGGGVGSETYTQIRSDLPNVSPTFTGNTFSW